MSLFLFVALPAILPVLGVVAWLLYDVTVRLVAWHRSRHITAPPGAWCAHLGISSLPPHQQLTGEKRHLGRLYHAERYGVFRQSNLPPGVAIVVTHAELVHAVFKALPDKPRVVYDRLRFMGEGVHNIFSLPTNDEWKRRRRAFQHSFNKNEVRKRHSLVEQHVAELSHILRSRDGEVLDLDELFSALTVDVITHLGFDTDLGALRGEDCGLTKALQHAISYDAMFMNYSPLIAALVMPNERKQRVLRARKVGSAAVSRIYDEFLARYDAADASAKAAMDDLLMSRLLRFQRENAGVTRQHVLAEMGTFIAAGYDTTAHSLYWTVYCLARTPEALRRVVQELETAADGEWPFLDACIKEAMRLYPTAGGGVAKYVDQDIELNGLKLPKGALVTVSAYAVHRLKHNWGEDANEFKPERFLNDPALASEAVYYGAAPSALGPEAKAFVPFGGGPRNCIGMQLSILELRLTLSTLLRDFVFELPEGPSDAPWDLGVQGLTLRPTDSNMRVRVRHARG